MREPSGERFEVLIQIMERLRADGGCPWDREQTRQSLKPFLIEEAYEVVEAIDERIGRSSTCSNSPQRAASPRTRPRDCSPSAGLRRG